MYERAIWWPVHVRETYRYVMGLYAKKPSEQKIAVTHLLGGAARWGDLTGVLYAADLMKAHVGGAKGVADGAFGGDKKLIGRSVSDLTENAGLQTDLYKGSFRTFPADDWKALFDEHIKETGAYIVALGKGDRAGFGRHYSKVQENMARLSQFWGSTPLILRQ